MKAPIKQVKKVWGEESWMVNEAEYCFKLLVIHPGYQSSLHYHKKKKETFIVKKGTCMLLLRKKDKETISTLEVGDSVTISPGNIHQFWVIAGAEKPCVVYEISTHHDDNDVERLQESSEL